MNRCIKGRATPPPFRVDDWEVTSTEVTILSYRGDEPRRTGYQFQIDNGVWTDSSAWTELLATSTVRIRPIILGLLYGAPSDKKVVTV